MKPERQAAKPQNRALARGLVLTHFLREVAVGNRDATLDEVLEAKEELDRLLPDAADEPRG